MAGLVNALDHARQLHLRPCAHFLEDRRIPIDAKAGTWGDEIRPASAVNVFGRVQGDPTVFKKVRAGVKITLERTDT